LVDYGADGAETAGEDADAAEFIGVDHYDLVATGVYPTDSVRTVFGLAVLVGGLAFGIGQSLNLLVEYAAATYPNSVNYVPGCLSYEACRFPRWYYVFEPVELALLSVGLVWVTLAGNYLALFYIRIWGAVESCFAVDTAEYTDLVHRWLRKSFDGQRIGSLFLVVYAAVMAAIATLGCTYDAVGVSCDVGYVYAGFTGSERLLDASFHLLRMVVGTIFVGIVVFVFVTAAYAIGHFLMLTRRVMALPIRNIETAAHRFEPVARMSLVASTAYFVSVGLLLIYPILRAGMSLFNPFWVTILGVLTTFGLAFFFGTMEIIHRSLKRTKVERVQELADEYDAIVDQWRPEESNEALSVKLELVDTRRQRAEQISTWPYDLPILVELLASSSLPSLITALVPELVR
jgi:hypothetical protein